MFSFFIIGSSYSRCSDVLAVNITKVVSYETLHGRNGQYNKFYGYVIKKSI